MMYSVVLWTNNQVEILKRGYWFVISFVYNELRKAVEIAMKPSDILKAHREEIRQIILANKGLSPRIFGSVARGEDIDGSDLDIIIDPAPRLSYMDIGTMMYEIQERFNLKVDIATVRALPERFREKALNMAVPL